MDKTLKKLSKDIATCLSDDLLHKDYKAQKKGNALAGHCYVASEALYWLGAKEKGYTPHFVAFSESRHWYLKNKESGEILDPTADQFNRPVPYQNGRAIGFLTNAPSKRAAVLIDRVKKLNKDY